MTPHQDQLAWFLKPPSGCYFQDRDKTEAKDCQGPDKVEHVSRSRPVSRTTPTQSLTFACSNLPKNKSEDDGKNKYT